MVRRGRLVRLLGRLGRTSEIASPDGFWRPESKLGRNGVIEWWYADWCPEIWRELKREKSEQSNDTNENA